MGFIPDIEKICKLRAVHAGRRCSSRRPCRRKSSGSPAASSTIPCASRWRGRPRRSRPSTRRSSSPRQPRGEARDAAPADPRRAELKNAIIFCNRKRDVATLARSLKRTASPPVALHGDMDQKSRMETLDASGRTSSAAGRQRRRGARPRHSRRQPRLQLRRAVPRRRLRAPHRPHRPRRPQRRRDHPRGAVRPEGGGRNRKADRPTDPMGRSARRHPRG